jgi:exoribonuclease R
VLGIFRKIQHGGGRLEPVEKKMVGKELTIPAGATADAEDGDLIAVETSRAPRLGLPTARVVERLGSLKSERAVSLIAIHAHSIPLGVPSRNRAGGGSCKAGDTSWTRRLAARALRHHRPAGR